MGFSELEAFFLVCCSCSARHVSLAMEKLENLKTLRIFGVDLAVMGVGTGAGDGAMEIASSSLSSLELMESKASALILRQEGDWHRRYKAMVKENQGLREKERTLNGWHT